MDQNKLIGAAIATLGGSLLIAVAFVLPVLSSFHVNEAKLAGIQLTAEQQTLLRPRTNLTISEMRDSIREAASVESLKDGAGFLNTLSLAMKGFMWLVAGIGAAGVGLGLTGTRKVKYAGKGGLAIGMLMLTSALSMSRSGGGLIDVSMGLGPIVAVVGGALLIVASLYLPGESIEKFLDREMKKELEKGETKKEAKPPPPPPKKFDPRKPSVRKGGPRHR